MRSGSAEVVATPAASAASSVSLPAAPRARRAWLAAIPLVAAAAVLPYLNAWPGTLVFDDHLLLEKNPLATPGMHAWDWFFRESIPGSVYRPLTMATLALNGGAQAPGPYHATNVAIHLLATLAAFFLARRLLGSARDAAVAAVLFAVHPIHTEAVANIAGRAELLAGFFVLVALWAGLRFVDGGGALALATAIVAGLAGTLSKESAVTVCLLWVIVVLWRGRRLDRRTVLVAVGLGAACVASVAARVAVLGSLGTATVRTWADNPLAQVGALQRIATALVVLADYFGTLTLPIRLSADDSYNQIPLVESPTDLRLVSAVALVVVLGIAAFRARRRTPAAWWGALFALAALAVTANVLFPIGTIRGERLLYLPAFGWCLACAGLASRRPRLGLAVVGIVAVLFAGRTWVRNDDWHDDYRLFTATAITSPNSVRAQSNAGAVLAEHGELGAALKHYQAAVDIFPDFPLAQLGLGRVLAMIGQPAAALAALDRARTVEPTNVEAHLRAADLRLDTGDAAGAERTYREGLAVAPTNGELLVGLALADVALGRRDDAVAIRRRVEGDERSRAGSVPQRLAMLAEALGEAPRPAQ